MSTLSGSVSPALSSGDVWSFVVGAPGVFRQAWNRVESCVRAAKYVSPIFENGESLLVCINASVKS